MSQSKNWCYTLNNYSEIDEVTIQGIDCKYSIYGREVGLLGTPHLQGYIVFEKNKRFKAVQKLFPAGAHLEKSVADSSKNIVYCSKENDVFTKGEPPLTNKEKGEKNAQRYKDAFTAAKENRLDDIPEDMRTRHYGTYKRIAMDYAIPPPDMDRLTGVWIYGAAGAGKSRYARKMYPGAYLKNAANKWWNGYQMQDYVIIDDFDKFMVAQGHNLKIWGDRYAFPAEDKGGEKIIRPKTIVITSQYHPHEIWDDEETRAAIKRRYMMIYMENGNCVVQNNKTFL